MNNKQHCMPKYFSPTSQRPPFLTICLFTSGGAIYITYSVLLDLPTLDIDFCYDVKI